MNTTFSKTKRLVMSCRSIMIAASILIAGGYLLMSGTGSTEQAFNPDIFSPRRIIIAPILCLTGYLMIIVGILRIGK